MFKSTLRNIQQVIAQYFQVCMCKLMCIYFIDWSVLVDDWDILFSFKLFACYALGKADY